MICVIHPPLPAPANAKNCVLKLGMTKKPLYLDSSRVEQVQRHRLDDYVEEGAGVPQQLVDQQEVHVAGLEELREAATERLVHGGAAGRHQAGLREHVLATDGACSVCNRFIVQLMVTRVSEMGHPVYPIMDRALKYKIKKIHSSTFQKPGQ